MPPLSNAPPLDMDAVKWAFAPVLPLRAIEVRVENLPFAATNHAAVVDSVLDIVAVTGPAHEEASWARASTIIEALSLYAGKEEADATAHTAT